MNQLCLNMLPFPLGLLRVSITAQDLRDGVPCNHKSCPIALAVNRATDWEWEVTRTWAIALNLPPGQRAQFYLPECAFEQQKAFDFSKPVAPFEFECYLEMAPEFPPAQTQKFPIVSRRHYANCARMWHSSSLEQCVMTLNRGSKSVFGPFNRHATLSEAALQNMMSL